MTTTSSAPDSRIAARLARRSGRRRLNPWFAVPVVLLIGVGLFWWMRSATATTTAPTVTTVAVTQGTLSASVAGSGTVAARNERALSFAVSGTIAEVLVEVGDTVKADQPLAALDMVALDLAVQQAEANLKAAQATLAAANGEGATPEQIAAAEAQLRSAQASLSRTRSGDVTASDIASARAQLNSAQAQLNSLLAGPTADELASAQANIHQAELNLQSQSNSLASAKVKAESQVTTAANSLRDAQDAYSTLYWQNRQKEDAGRLTQSDTDNESAAQRAVTNAEENLRQA